MSFSFWVHVLFVIAVSVIIMAVFFVAATCRESEQVKSHQAGGEKVLGLHVRWFVRLLLVVIESSVQGAMIRFAVRWSNLATAVWCTRSSARRIDRKVRTCSCMRRTSSISFPLLL